MLLRIKSVLYLGIITALVLSLQGCSGFFASSGPSRSQIQTAAATDEQNPPTVTIVNVDNKVAQRVLAVDRTIQFKDLLTPAKAPENLIGPGDTIDVLVWEAPPAILFTSAPTNTAIAGAALSNMASPRQGGSTNASTTSSTIGMPMTALPAQVVSKQGTILFPFIGRLQVNGKTLSQIEAMITERLLGKANQPQVMARLINGYASTVSVVGELNTNVIMPLSPKGEKLMDAIAFAGGPKQPVNKTTIRVSRGGQTQSVPMEAVIQDPRQNIFLLPGDVVTAYYQPLSLNILGSVGKNDEITFEAQGIMLSQALARAGGLVNSISDAKGVFIFRYEDPRAIDNIQTVGQPLEDGRVPVVYQFDMTEPSTYFAVQNFPVKNKDMLYIASAPSVELNKFLSILTSVLSPAAAINSGALSGVIPK